MPVRAVSTNGSDQDMVSTIVDTSIPADIARESEERIKPKES